jgi:hypothetical protein
MAYADDFITGVELPDGDFDPEQPFKDISEYCRLQRVQPELQPANKIKNISEDKRNGRMKNFLMSMDKCEEAAVRMRPHAKSPAAYATGWAADQATMHAGASAAG